MSVDLAELWASCREADRRLRGSFWMHAKGGLYKVAGVAACSETKELRVTYVEVGDDCWEKIGIPPWSRPYDMWDTVVSAPNGEQVPRFELVPGGPGCLERMRAARGVEE